MTDLRVFASIVLAVVAWASVTPVGATGPARTPLLAELSYGGEQPVLQIDRRGRVTAISRDRAIRVQYTRQDLERLCPHLYDGSLRDISQARLDAVVADAERRVDRAAPLGGDSCQMLLPTATGVATLRLDAPGVLSGRIDDVCPVVRSFESVRSDLERLRNATLVGGMSEVERLAEVASARSGHSIVAEDLSFADVFGQQRTLQFQNGRSLVMLEVRGESVEVVSFDLTRPE